MNLHDEYKRNEQTINELCLWVCEREARSEPCYIETRHIMLLLERQQHLSRVAGIERSAIA
jgi:hypothetical protein